MIRNRLLLAMISGAASLLVAACGGGSTVATGSGPSATGTALAPSALTVTQAEVGIPFDILPESAQFSGVAEQRMVAVRDAAAWNTLWAEHVGTAPPRPAPQIDFSRHMVIAAFFGWRGACDTMSIDAVKQKADPARIEVTYRVTPPPPNTACIAIATSPVIFVTVPKSSLPVEFVQAPERAADALVIRSGWSFGFCLDNCQAAVEIAKEGATYRATPKKEMPSGQRAIWGAVSPQEWETLAATFHTLPDVTVGCPDCADEGREWIEVERAGTRKRLDFSCNAVIGEAARFQGTIRAIRSRLAAALGAPEPCYPGGVAFEPVTPAVFTSQIADKRFVAIRDAASWAALWREHAGSNTPAPAIDFSQSMVLGVFAGPESATCGSTRIESVRRLADPDRLAVGYRVIHPGPEVVCIAAMINQYALVTVPASPLPVEFIKLP